MTYRHYRIPGGYQKPLQLSVDRLARYALPSNYENPRLGLPSALALIPDIVIPPPLFAPDEVSAAPKIWLDGQDGAAFSLSGSDIDAWASKGAGSVPFTASGALRPTRDAGAFPGAVFDGTNNRLDGTIGITNSNGTIFVVYTPNVLQSQWLVSYGSGSSVVNANSLVPAATATFGSLLLTATSDPTAVVSSWEDNTDLVFGDHKGVMKANITVSPAPTASTTVSIGGRSNGTLPFSGTIHEVICYETKLPIDERMGIMNYLTAKWANLQDAKQFGPPAIDLFLAAGQSNHINGFPLEAVDLVETPRAYEMVYPVGGEWVSKLAVNPTLGPDIRSERMGFMVDFLRDYVGANPTSEAAHVMAAVGGTGFQDNEWNQGDPNYAIAVSRVNELAAIYGDAMDFKGVIWHQGEQDAVVGRTELQYAADLDAMIAAMRADITAADANTLFIVGGLSEEWLAADAQRLPVQAALEDTPARVANTLFVSSTGLLTSDGLHFTSEAMRTLGSRYHDVYSGN